MRKIRRLGVLIVIGLIAAACGDDGGGGGTTSGATTAATTEATTGATSGGPTTAATTGGETSAPVEPADVTVFLGFIPDGLYAPVYVANELGYFDDEKLNVTIQPGTGSNSAVKVVGAGRAEFGFADALTMSHGVAGGAPLKMLAVELREPPAATVVLKTSGIKTIPDLKGKTIGDSQDSAQVPILPCLLEANGLTMDDIEFVNLGFPEQVPSLLAGRVDALEGYGYFYGNLADKVDLLPWSEHGLDYYSEGIFVNTDFLAENEGVVRRFLRAFIKGFQYELDNPDEAAKLLAQGAGDPKSEDFFNYEIHAILPMLTDSDTDANGLGHMADDKWQSTVDTLKCGGVENPPAPDTLFTNDYLPATEG